MGWKDLKELWVGSDYHTVNSSEILEMEERTMSCPPGMAFLSEGGSSLGEETPSASSRNEVDDKEDKEEKANSKTSLSSERTASRKDNSGKSQPVDLTQVLFPSISKSFSVNVLVSKTAHFHHNPTK